MFSVKVRANSTSPMSIELYDVQGRSHGVIFTGSLEAGQERVFDHDGQHLAKGMYFVRYLSGDDVRTLKVVITK